MNVTVEYVVPNGSILRVQRFPRAKEIREERDSIIVVDHRGNTRSFAPDVELDIEASSPRSERRLISLLSFCTQSHYALKVFLHRASCKFLHGRLRPST